MKCATTITTTGQPGDAWAFRIYTKFTALVDFVDHSLGNYSCRDGRKCGLKEVAASARNSPNPGQKFKISKANKTERKKWYAYTSLLDK